MNTTKLTDTDTQTKGETHGTPEHEEFKEQQKLPKLPDLLAVGTWSLLVPANELEFANFYHL